MEREEKVQSILREGWGFPRNTDLSYSLYAFPILKPTYEALTCTASGVHHLRLTPLRHLEMGKYDRNGAG